MKGPPQVLRDCDTGETPLDTTDHYGRSVLARNTFTWLNLILVLLGGATLATGSLPDASFLAVAVVNTAVGSVQELRARRTIERMAVLEAAPISVWHVDRFEDVPVEEVRVGDTCKFRSGDQIGVDAVVVSGDAEVDESLITGEADPVSVAVGDQLVSGTWVVGGSVVAKASASVEDSYAARLLTVARRTSLARSELVYDTNRILRWLAVLLVVIGPVLVFRELQIQPWRPAVRSATAGLVGMIPEGLVLLITVAFFSGAVRLARSRVLTNELPAIEVLARVDVVCTDKTGTLTFGRPEWDSLITAPPVFGHAEGEVRQDCVREALAALADDPDSNSTFQLISRELGPAPGWVVDERIPFSSARKWSGAHFRSHGTWVLGAPEFVSGADPFDLRLTADALSELGKRVLLLAKGVAPFRADRGDALPPDLEVVALVVLGERIRPGVESTIEYLRGQGVDIKVVSGDAAPTVAAIAVAVGFPAGTKGVDARLWPALVDRLDPVIDQSAVFGRVKPDQKVVIIESLQRQGHSVAMIGDGVNDTMALKEADLGIAMGSGSQISRQVAKLVLLDDQFTSLPSILGEARRVLSNIERAASLFLTKNTYSLLLSAIVALAGWPYPLVPRQVALISGLLIGAPAFAMSFTLGTDRYLPGFLTRTLRFSLPAGVVIAVAATCSYVLARRVTNSIEQSRMVVVMVISIMSLWVLILRSRPLDSRRVMIVATTAAAVASVFLTPVLSSFFQLSSRPGPDILIESLLIAAAGCVPIHLIAVRAGRRPRAHANEARRPRRRGRLSRLSVPVTPRGSVKRTVTSLRSRA